MKTKFLIGLVIFVFWVVVGLGVIVCTISAVDLAKELRQRRLCGPNKKVGWLIYDLAAKFCLTLIFGGSLALVINLMGG